MHHVKVCSFKLSEKQRGLKTHLKVKLTLSLIQVLIICAVANSFVFSILMLEKKENRFANRFLFLTILSLCLSFTPYMLDPKIWHTHRWLAWLPFSLSYWTGPSFYFYIKLLTDASFRFTKRHLWHFAPIILNYLHSGYHGMLWPGDPWPWFHFFAELLESFAIVSILVYMLIAYRLISSYQKSLLDNVSNTTKMDLRWARQTIIVIITSFLMILVFLIVSSGISGKVFFNQWNDYRNTVLLLYAGVLYWIGIQGYRQTQTLKLKRHKENSLQITD